MILIVIVEGVDDKLREMKPNRRIQRADVAEVLCKSQFEYPLDSCSA